MNKKVTIGVIIAVVIIGFGIVACGKGGSSSQAGGGNPPPVVDPITSGLPPDPGEAGKVTIAGTVTTNMGIRDDVLRYIVLTYPNSQKTQKALEQNALAFQHFLTATSTDGIYSSVTEMWKSTGCVSFVDPQNWDADLSKLQDAILNTDLRNKTYFDRDDQFAGQVISLDRPDENQDCNFDLTSLSN